MSAPLHYSVLEIEPEPITIMCEDNGCTRPAAAEITTIEHDPDDGPDIYITNLCKPAADRRELELSAEGRSYRREIIR